MTAPPNVRRKDIWERIMIDAFCIWRLCGAARCLRACACRGDPQECLPRCAPLVPQDARDFFVGLGEAQADGLPFEDAIEELADQRAALTRWREAVDRSLARKAAPHKNNPARLKGAAE